MKHLFQFLAGGGLVTIILIGFSPFEDKVAASASLQATCNGITHTLVITNVTEADISVNGTLQYLALTSTNFPAPGLISVFDHFQLVVGVTVSVLDITNNVQTTTTCGSDTSTSSSPLNFIDGRCNQEPWQSFAVYPDNKGGYFFYVIYGGVGYYAMHVTEQQQDDNPDKGFTYVVAQSKGVILYRLAGGILQAHRIGMNNKDYSFNIICGAMED